MRILHTLFARGTRSFYRPEEKIVIFTRFPVQGATKTRLIPLLGSERAANLQRNMTEHIVATAKKAAHTRSASLEIQYDGCKESDIAGWLGTDLSYAEQVGADLGTRMHSAFESAFENGFRKMVLIGSDCPGITNSLLESAFDMLSQCDAVLGPAEDGGYYLVGLRNSCPGLFANISWGTGSVLEQTVAAAQRCGLSVKLTDRLNDIDRPEDLEGLAGKFPFLLDSCSPESTGLEACSRISVIVPVFNEEQDIAATIERARASGEVEIIVVDGGSTDRTRKIARSLGVKVLKSPQGRAVQMNAAADSATGDILLFLHADTLLPDGWIHSVIEELKRPATAAAAFSLRFSSYVKGLKIVEMLANFRGRVLQMPYGDQAIFLRADLFREVGGYRNLPLMEDWDLVSRLRKRGRIRIVAAEVITSSRRWKKHGVFRTTALHQVIILGYLFGVPLSTLAKLRGRAHNAAQ